MTVLLATFLFFKFIYLFVAVLGLRCCTWAFSTCGKRGLLFVAVYGLLIAVASLVGEHGLQALRLSSCGAWAQQLWLTGSRAQAQQLWHTGLVVPRMWDPPRPGVKPTSPALAGGFLTTAPSWKSYLLFFIKGFFFNFYFIYLFFGCVGSSLLHRDFLQLWRAGAALHCGAWASHCGGFSLVAEHGLQAYGLQQLWLVGSSAQAQWLWYTGLVAPWHVRSSQTRDQTHVPCVGRRILNHCATREVLPTFLRKRIFLLMVDSPNRRELQISKHSKSQDSS